MISLPGAFLWAWVAVHAGAASLAFAVFARSREREQLAHGVLSLAALAYCLAETQVTEAAAPGEAAPWQSLQFAAGSACFWAYARFTAAMVGHPGAGALRLIDGATGTGLLLTLTGLFVDPAYPILPRSTLALSHEYRDAGMLPLGTAYVSAGIAVGVWFIVQLGPALRRRADARVLAAAGILLLGGWAYDALLRVMEVRGLYLSGHATSVAVLVAGVVLGGRFGEVAEGLAAKRKELRRAYEELRQVQEELVKNEQLAAVGELSAVIAREVRNPLTVLRRSVASLRRPGLATREGDVLLGVLDEETDRLNRLVRDLLTYARPVAPQAQSIPLAIVLAEAFETARRNEGRASVRASFELDGAPEVIEGDRDLLGRAFRNVMENALGTVFVGGSIVVRAAAAEIDGHAAVEVRVEGGGEPTPNPAGGLDPLRSRLAGRGLGLAIVERVIHAHGGRMRLKEEAGAGDRVVVLTLPLRPRSSRMPAAP